MNDMEYMCTSEADSLLWDVNSCDLCGLECTLTAAILSCRGCI